MDYQEFSEEEYFEYDLQLYGKPLVVMIANVILSGMWDNIHDHFIEI